MFLISRVLILFGLGGIVYILGVNPIVISLYALILNLVLRILSFVLKYDDGKEIFHNTYYFSLFMLLLFGFFSWPLLSWLEIVMIWISCTFGIYAFLVFIGNACGRVLSKRTYSLLFLFGFLSFMISILYYIGIHPFYTLILAQTLLTLLYIIIFFLLWYANRKIRIESIVDDRDDLRMILAGKQYNYTKRKTRYDTLIYGSYTFLRDMDGIIKHVLSFLNIVFIVLQIIFLVFYREYAGWEILDIWQLRIAVMRLGIMMFFINYLLLKKINFPRVFQRGFAFILLSFGIYLSVLDTMGRSAIYFVIAGTMRSVVNSILMTLSGKRRSDLMLQAHDYLYRMGANMLISVCNVYFMFLLPFSLQMRFFLVLVYCGIQMFLLMYNIKYTFSNDTMHISDYKIGI